MLIVALVAVDTASADSTWGTLRYVVASGIPRIRVIAAKVTVIATSAIAAPVLVLLAGTLAGLRAFGWHNVFVPSGAHLTPIAATGKLGLISLCLGLCTMCAAALAFAVAERTGQAAGATRAALGLVIGGSIADGIPALHPLAVILPVHYWSAWTGLLTGETGPSLLVGSLDQIAATLLLLTVAAHHFTHRDITS